MANEYTVNSADMVKVANAIRSKGGTSNALVFPNGFVNAISAIQAGTGGESGGGSGGSGSANLVVLHIEEVTEPVSAVWFEIPDSWKQYDALICVQEDVVMSAPEWIVAYINDWSNYLGLAGGSAGVTVYDRRRAEILVTFSNGIACIEQKNAGREETDAANITWMAFTSYYDYNTINSGRFKIVGCKF